MPGAGIRPAIMSVDPPARLLDLTRLVSRAGHATLTGVDRVERAYLRELMGRPGELFALVRTASGQALLDRGGIERLVPFIDGQAHWGPPDLAGHLSRRLPPARRAAEGTVRRLARATVPTRRLRRVVAALPPGTRYVNTGHSNLTEPVLSVLARALGGRVTVFLHDTIPLDLPQYQRPETAASFRARFRATLRHADQILCNSAATARDIARHAEALGLPAPPITAAHLGVEPPVAGQLPPQARPPWFVTVGTIEPRKNHALLLDLWAALHVDMGPDTPRLLILGSRGWENAETFARLDALGPLAGHVHELSGLDDAAVAATVRGAVALLLPSHAEGYGLPAMEAAALGTPVAATPLPAMREVLGDWPVYAAADDMYQWRQAVEQLNRDRGREADDRSARIPAIPTWADHFNKVLKVI